MKKIISTGIAAALALGSAAALADSITYTTDDTGTTIGLTTTNWDTTNPPPNALELPYFDVTLGTLTGVTVTYMGGAEFIYKIENIDGGASSTGNNTLLVNEIFTPSLSALSGSTLQASSGLLSFSLTVFDGTVDFGGDSGFDFGTLTDSVQADEVGGNLSEFVGTGNWTIDVSASSDSDRNVNGGNLIENTTWSASAWAKVVYTYDAPTPPQQVPEPAGLALLGLGLAGLGFRRKSKKA